MLRFHDVTCGCTESVTKAVPSVGPKAETETPDLGP
jgi:hypothetical protein